MYKLLLFEEALVARVEIFEGFIKESGKTERSLLCINLCMNFKKKIKSSLYSRYYAEACNEWWGHVMNGRVLR